MTSAVDKQRPTVALIMSGGGARAAYQVGVLRAIARILPRGAPNPFRIICGTSAGAINAASLASNIDHFDLAVRQLAQAWGSLHVGQVYRADFPGTVRTFFRAGHMLDAIFIDTLDMDLERLQRVNQTISQIPAGCRTNDARELRTIETLIIRPSPRMDVIAAAHARELPRTMRFLMRRVGVLEPNGARVLSYLLFEQGYCRRLMYLGFTDALTQRNDILSFLGYNNTGALKRKTQLRVIPTN